MRSRTGIITMFDFSMPFFTPRKTTAQTTSVKTSMQTNGDQGAATNPSKKACGFSRAAPPDATRSR